MLSKLTHFSNGTNQDAYIRSGQTAGKVVIQDTGGNVGIATSTANKTCHVDGELLVTGENDSYQNEHLHILYINIYV